MQNIVIKKLKEMFDDEIRYLERAYKNDYEWVREPKIHIDCCRSRCLGAMFLAESFDNVDTHEIELLYNDYTNKMYKMYKEYKKKERK